MGRFLQIVGAVWALLGLLNILLMPWQGSSTLLGFGLILNVMVFILPGLGLCGLGSIVARPKA